MTDQPSPPPRVCGKGHTVNADNETGRVATKRGRPYLICTTCEADYKRDVRRLFGGRRGA